MGRIKKVIEKLKEQESSDILKEFNVRVFNEEKHKLEFIGFVKAKTKDSAINKIAEDFKDKPYSYSII